ncbi:MAG: tetratricopeptide repeat protein [Burkholderiaceae bacterium]|nr:tetratricopeptide repeat protein [Burkholderiaceae bacterium]
MGGLIDRKALVVKNPFGDGGVFFGIDFAVIFKNKASIMKIKKTSHLNRFASSRDNTCEESLRLMDRGDHEGALAGLEAVLAKTPGDLEAGLNKGLCLAAMGQLEQAARHLQSVHESAPSDPLILKVCAQVHGHANYFDMALKFWSRYAKAKPEDYDAWAGMAYVSLRLGDDISSLMYATQALSLDPQNSHAYNNLGTALLGMDRLDDAEQAFQTALALEPGNFNGLTNLALLCFLRGNYKEAVHEYESILPSVNPESVAFCELLYRSSFAYLGTGQLREGWRRYENGLQLKDSSARWPQPKLTAPRWTGEPLGDKRLLVWGEQGLGDELQFYGLLNELKGMCQNITVECDPRLVSLLMRSLPDITVRAQNRNSFVLAQDCYAHIPAGSLAGIFRNQIEDFKKQRPYIKPNPKLEQDFSDRLKPYADKKLVGLSWRSGSVNARRVKHYMRLEEISEILSNPDYAFVNLQYGDCEQELLNAEAALGIKIVRWHDVDLKDDQEAVAALIGQLDVVLSPLSAVGQMTMAVGVALIAFGQPLWMSLGQEHYPWSKNVELITPIAGQELSTIVPRIVASLERSGSKDGA